MQLSADTKQQNQQGWPPPWMEEKKISDPSRFLRRWQEQYKRFVVHQRRRRRRWRWDRRSRKEEENESKDRADQQQRSGEGKKRKKGKGGLWINTTLSGVKHLFPLLSSSFSFNQNSRSSLSHSLPSLTPSSLFFLPPPSS